MLEGLKTDADAMRVVCVSPFVYDVGFCVFVYDPTTKYRDRRSKRGAANYGADSNPLGGSRGGGRGARATVAPTSPQIPTRINCVVHRAGLQTQKLKHNEGYTGARRHAIRRKGRGNVAGPVGTPAVILRRGDGEQ